MTALGLQSNINDLRTNNSGTSSSNKKVIELFDIPESGIIPAKTYSQILLPMSVNDQKYMVRLMEKHGTNYKAMERDMKLNNMQHTERKLLKMVEKFLSLSSEQRVVEISDQLASLVN